MPSYPAPEEHPSCQCRHNLMQAMFCGVGHMTECHYPYDCSTAGCTHLFKYDLSPEAAQKLDEEATQRILEGKMPPYEMDAYGNAHVQTRKGERT